MVHSFLQNRYAALAACAAAILSAGPSSAEDALARLPILSNVAPDAIQISPHVPQMGHHWARPENLPGGPIYCVVEGRVTCMEYMVDMADLVAGASWRGLAAGIETPPISHVDIEFKPDGIGPNPVPLYQIHIYFTGPETLARH
jgi:hypothetical protein